MPLVAFVLLLVVCVALLGFACACLGDQLAPGLDRPFTPALIVVWTALAAALLTPLGLMAALAAPARGRASPAELQRFLF